MTTFYLGKENIDILDEVNKNKLFVKRLRKNGIDSRKISDLLTDMHGLKMELPVKISKEEKEFQTQTSYATRWLKNLTSNPVIIDDDKKVLIDLYEKYDEAQKVLWTKSKRGKDVVRVRVGGESKDGAKSIKQVIGLCVVALYEYISSFNGKNDGKTFLQKDIFNLISELFEIIGLKYTQEQIKTLYRNNK